MIVEVKGMDVGDRPIDDESGVSCVYWQSAILRPVFLSVSRTMYTVRSLLEIFLLIISKKLVGTLISDNGK